MSKLTLIEIEWNKWNGFNIEICRIETENHNRALFSFWYADRELLLSIFFINIEIK